MIETVEASCRNKAEVVALDEKEGGVRATLNLGHTFGHAIETKAGYGTYLHGEAVGIGMHMAAKMSRDLGWISDELFERAVALVARAKVPIVLPLDSPLGRLYSVWRTWGPSSLHLWGWPSTRRSHAIEQMKLGGDRRSRANWVHAGASFRIE